MPRPARNADCHPDRKHIAKGLCAVCYTIYTNNRTREHRNKKAVEWRSKNKDKTKTTYLKGKFGITLEDYNNRREVQDNLCAICQIGKAEHLDHHHTSGKIRKFLCFKCNMGIGYLNEDENLFIKATQYLRENN